MEHITHEKHDHEHGDNCGHTAVQHGDHVDYVHDGHLHNRHGDHVDEHKLDHNAKADCAPHDCDEHATDHKHSNSCGHEAVPHGDHADYLVDDHLHHAHNDHCDDHGKVAVKK